MDNLLKQSDSSAATTSLTDIAHSIARAGALMAAAGTGAYRVKEEMNRVGRALGIDLVLAEVTLNTITLTCYRHQEMVTLVEIIPSVSVNAERLGNLETLALELKEGTSVREFNQKLSMIARKPRPHNQFALVIAAMVACTGFCFLNHGGWLECVCVAIGAGAGQFLRLQCERVHYNQLGVAMICALVSALVYIGVLSLFAHFNYVSDQTAAGYTSTVLYLIPGFPLITGTLDLARLDFSAGMARLMYAIQMIVGVSISIWVVAELVGIVPFQAPVQPLDTGILLLLTILATFCGVVALAMMFKSTYRVAIYAALIATLCNTIRMILCNDHLVSVIGRFLPVETGTALLPIQMASPLATFLVGCAAALISPLVKCPRVVLSVPAVVIMIPGATAYQSLVYANLGMSSDAISSAFQAIYIIVGIVTGLALARMVTDRHWAYGSTIPGSLRKAV